MTPFHDNFRIAIRESTPFVDTSALGLMLSPVNIGR